ncbi:hypothetical protein Tco_1136492 [Tanacetum coccineum]
MENSKRGSIPMQDKLRLSKSQGASTPAYGRLKQNITSRFQQNPGDLHWTTVKNILKYLRNTKDMFLVLLTEEFQAKHFRYFICRSLSKVAAI